MGNDEVKQRPKQGGLSEHVRKNSKSFFTTLLFKVNKEFKLN
jgi:hypothetical protein